MSRFETSDGLSLYFEEHGSADGIPLICLPGLTRDGQDFRYALPHLGDYRVILMDLRGRGRSDYAQDPASYNILTEAGDVIALMDHLGLTRAALLGTSRGGLVAMAIAGTARDRLQAVILNDVGPDIAEEGLGRIFEYLGHRPAAKTHAAAARILEAAMRDSFANVPEGRWLEEAQTFYKETPDGLELRYDARLREAMLAQAKALSEMEEKPSLWPWFAALDGLPCGVIRGAHSDILSRETFDEMRRRLPALQAVELSDRGHIPFLDEPDALLLIHTVLKDIK
ncbi:alpha/beta hydrolase fold (plasmid) [Ruegeria sp. TM1040]|uniref:alpha/beta fold hydrolase n=1 Tax=Ruegeria sp. (strain TM1040) TaxID=292414 RepID=UPI0000462A87|nr:alpha/beta hydrolase [Ruegeria sp. TM1040]ABF62538.1 alpha/beta hydrolase fold [Ruegeria sp. TM1040]